MNYSDTLAYLYEVLDHLRQPDGGYRVCDMDTVEKILDSIRMIEDEESFVDECFEEMSYEELKEYESEYE
ncbi:MAG: hypothetical protein IIZ95_01085 [Erysipelotrichaceae bacterium]|nr:hypothetical protein [Erysipelotrichaceae bacterium]